jgi:hypothetical protein
VLPVTAMPVVSAPSDFFILVGADADASAAHTISPTGEQCRSSIERQSHPIVDLHRHLESTNMKLVARCRVMDPASFRVSDIDTPLSPIGTGWLRIPD